MVGQVNCKGGQDSIVEVKAGEERHKIKIPSPPGWGLHVRLTTSPSENAIVVKVQESKYSLQAKVGWTHREDGGRTAFETYFLPKTKKWVVEKGEDPEDVYKRQLHNSPF